MKADELSQAEIEAARPRVALLPLGALEGHGAHLPLGTDAFIAADLARRVAERVESAIVLPVLPYGMSWSYRDLPLTLSLSTETLTRVIVEIVESLLEQGIRRIVIVNGHDGNVPAIEAAARRIEKEHGVALAALEEWWMVLPPLVPAETFEPRNQGHAGEAETALALAACPELVRLELARPPGSEPDLRYYGRAGVRLFGKIGEHYPTGEFPDPRGATKETGELAMERLVERLVEFLDRSEASS